MYNVNNFEWDCTKKCKCPLHGQQITAALTKRSIPDDKLAAYIAKTCSNFANITDPLGRNALHISASVDRYAILEWLLNQGAPINAPDRESGSTALHRAIYYGCVDCAVLLIRYGASLDKVDLNFRSALQNCCRVCDMPRHRYAQPVNELLVWGLNKNYNLGTGDEECVSVPQHIDFFRKENISITALSLGSFHSLFVDTKGILYAVGHGKGGRLGYGKDLSLPIPKKVKLPTKTAGERVIQVSTSRKHSLVLSDKSGVFACGLNDDKQLGIESNPDFVTSFKRVAKLSDTCTNCIRGVIAQDFSSLAYSTESLYVWGKNSGQFGWIPASTTHIPLPKMVQLPEKERLDIVVSSNFVIACSTTSRSIILLYNYKVKCIKAPQFETIKGLSIIGGDSTSAECGSASAVKLLVLTRSNVLFIWYGITHQFLRCYFPNAVLTEIDKVLYRANQVMILSRGDVYTGKCNQLQLHTPKTTTKSTWVTEHPSNKDICNDKKIKIILERVTHLDRVTDIFCDEDFKSFAVIQESCYKFYKVSDLLKERYSFQKLLLEAHEDDDIHDIVFHVDGKCFYAHKFLVYSHSRGLKDIVTAANSKHVYIELDRFTATMFGLILKHIYTDHFISCEDVRLMDESLGRDCPHDGSLKLFLEFITQFQLTDLAKHVVRLIEYTSSVPYFVALIPYSPSGDPPMADLPRYDSILRRSHFPDLYDVTIRCADGIEVRAHKCVLVSQLEYFEVMFANAWAEGSVVNLSNVPAAYMVPILDFIYTLDATHFRKQNYTESYLYNMIVFCDQFFIESLRKVCESLVLQKISVRKCGDMLEFANTYNCDLLQSGCMDFICQNLYRVLLQRSLEECSPPVLSAINAHYRKLFKQVFDYRMITPDSEAIEDELLLSFVENFEVDLDYKPNEEDQSMVNGKKKNKKASEMKDKQKKQYEQDAINEMKKLNLQDAESESSMEKVKIQKEAKDQSETSQTVPESWRTVSDKREIKKSPAVAGLNANEILKTESKPKEEFVNLAQVVESAHNLESSPPKSSASNFNLGDFTPVKAEKLSQKQRKRLSSDTSRNDQQPTSTSALSIPPQPIPNAWGINNCSQSSDNDLTNSLGSPSNSPSKRILSNGPSTSTGITHANFSQILDDERKQRDYVDKLKNKSLALTQIEETAISELCEFYNVENADDEVITVERKKCPLTMNFAVWQKK